MLFLVETPFLTASVMTKPHTGPLRAAGRGQLVEGIEIRTVMRARAGLADLDLVGGARLDGGSPRVPRPRGERGPHGGGPTQLDPLARRPSGLASEQDRDAVVERDRIRSALHVAHRRRARRRRMITRLA